LQQLGAPLSLTVLSSERLHIHSTFTNNQPTLVAQISLASTPQSTTLVGIL
jgi:hypothetical protein